MMNTSSSLLEAAVELDRRFAYSQAHLEPMQRLLRLNDPSLRIEWGDPGGPPWMGDHGGMVDTSQIHEIWGFP